MPSFDIVSRTDLVEVGNAVQGATREIGTRYDFKGSKCSIDQLDTVLTLNADDDFKLKQVCELLKGYLAKRKVNVASFEFNKSEKASGDTVRQIAIQNDELRVTGKKRDDLQNAITVVKELKIRHPLQYVNFRD